MLLDEPRRDEWNDFVRSAQYPTVMQTWQWGQLKSSTGWTPHVVAVEDGGAIAAGALVLARELPHVGRSLLYAPRGPIVDFDDAELVRSLLGEIRALAGERGAVALKIDPPVSAERSEVVELLEAEGFRFVGDEDPDLGGTQPRYVMKTDLTPDPEELLASFKSKWRYNIRLAGRRGVSVREGTREDLPRFYELLEGTARRDQFRVRDYSYFERMYDLLAPEEMLRLFVAQFEGRMVAGDILLRMGDEAVYVYGASDSDYHKHMPNHLLQWEMMQWAKGVGCTTYNLRGVSREVDGEPVGELGGLNRFKRGFAGQYMEYIGEWDLVYSPVWYRVYEAAQRLRR
ncbi:MAG: peptidoglycan bridge formation glycyltransferase FemA/FemB family protein [Armatimonadota bacterium]|nr:peptidoglycan bridge formation glycyltransferase FemA/FemB family protein [Armatimonadota bacterium]